MITVLSFTILFLLGLFFVLVLFAVTLSTLSLANDYIEQLKRLGMTDEARGRNDVSL